MAWVEVLTIIGSILVPMMGGFAWIIMRMDKKFERVDEKFERVDEKFERVCVRLDDIDSRLSRLEGRYEERLYWERGSTPHVQNVSKRRGRPPKNKTQETKQE